MLGLFFGILFPVLGIILLKFFPLPAGILITLVSGVFFFVTLAFKRK